jgi:hypothetical protein
MWAQSAVDLEVVKSAVEFVLRSALDFVVKSTMNWMVLINIK